MEDKQNTLTENFFDMKTGIESIQKEHPTLFSTPMVQAILEGRKTMTRRSCKDNGENLIGYEFVKDMPTYPEYWGGKKSEPYTGWIAKFNNLPIAMPRKCPYGKVGDVLWVRETWLYNDSISEPYAYKADYNEEHQQHMKGFWKPSIYMPKAACRIFLEITGIKVERLQDITTSDACDEGVNYWNIDAEALDGGELQADFENYTWKDDPNYKDYHFPTFANCIDSFRTLWEKINGEESWKENPWVWVIEFKVLRTTKKEL